MLLFALATLVTASLAQDHGSINDAVAHVRGKDEIVLPADHAAIDAKCGSGAANHSTNFKDGALVCADGRRFDDPETRAMGARISARADAYVSRVMRDPAVKRAIDGTVERETAAALRKLSADMRKRGR